MRLKTLLSKSLLVAVGLLVGASAWADEKTVTLFSQDFENVTSETLSTVWDNTDASYPASLVTGDATYGNYVSCTGKKSNNNQARNVIKFYGTAGNDIYTYDGTAVTNYTVEFDALFWSNVRTSNLYLFSDGVDVSSAPATSLFAWGNKAWKSSTVKITTNSDATFDLDKTAWYHYAFDIDGSNASKVSLTYTITNKSTNKVVKTGSYDVTVADGISYKVQGVYFGKALYDGILYADNFKVTTKVLVEGDVAEAPTITPTGVAANGGRTFKISFQEGETLHYTLPGGSEQTISEGSSVDVTATENGTLEAYTTKGTATSEKATATVDVTPIQLNVPSITLTGFAETDGLYYPIVAIASDQSTLSFVPSSTTLSYQLDGTTIEGGTPYTFAKTGTLTVTVSAEGYASSSATYEVKTGYVKTNTYDFANMKAEDLDLTTPKWTGPTETNYQTSSSSTLFTADGYAVGDDYRNNSAIEGVNMSAGTTLLIGHGLFPNVQRNFGYSLANLGSDQYVVWTYLAYSAETTALTSYNTTFTGNGNGLRFLVEKAEAYAPATYSVTINSNNLASYSNAQTVTVPEDVVIYIATAQDANTVTLTKVDGQVIPANTGVILYSAKTGEKTLTYGGTAPTVSGNILKNTASGAYTVTADGNIYALVKGEQAVAKVNADVAIPANKAYLEYSGNAAKLNIVFDGTVTGIDSVQTTNGTDGANAIYNLAGQRVSGSYKGVVVKGGKKFLQR